MDPQSAPRGEVLRAKDFMGWNVSDARGAKVGTVGDLLIDRSGKVRFLAVDTGLFRKSVLLPIRGLNWGEDSLVATDWSADEIKALPPYQSDQPLTAAVLAELERAYPRFYSERPTQLLDNTGEAHIVPLSQAKDFKLSAGAPTLRGWNVFGADGERVGVISEMLVDPVLMKVRYLDVDLADDLFQLTEDRHVVVPTEMVDLRERGQDVWVKGLPARAVAELPAYMGGSLDPLVKERVDRAFANVDPNAPSAAAETAPAPAAPVAVSEPPMSAPPGRPEFSVPSSATSSAPAGELDDRGPDRPVIVETGSGPYSAPQGPPPIIREDLGERDPDRVG
ncbi:MAG TPA: PRC-barrel domain-containing protein [Longimicrobiaceae bacterium]|jgi:sporulation protein YlmC with PRC-barrel domain|nr:PRC-barrel domain-containing protein [Longimicrobiaceae bacterium]